MSVQKLQLDSASSGVIFKKHPSKNVTGKLFSVSRLLKEANPFQGSAACYARITTAEFNSSGTVLYCSDSLGALFCLNLIENRYQKIVTLNSRCCILQSETKENGRLFAGTVDNTIRVVDVALGDQIQVLRGHTSNVSTISVQPNSGMLMLSTALDGAVLWDLQTFQKRRRLRARSKSAIQTVFFLPPSGAQMLSCLQDGSLFVWDSATLDCCYQLSSQRAPELPYRTLCVTDDGAVLFAAGKSPAIHVWNLLPRDDECDVENVECGSSVRDICEIITFPPNISSIRRLSWLPANQPSRVAATEKRQAQMSTWSGNLGGCLTVLGGDRQLRVLRRKSQPPLTSGSRSLLNTGNASDTNCRPQSTGLTTRRLSAHPSASELHRVSPWCQCLCLGIGTLEDPQLSAFCAAFYHSTHSSLLTQMSYLNVSGCRLVATISTAGRLDVYDLDASQAFAKQPAPPAYQVSGVATSDITPKDPKPKSCRTTRSLSLSSSFSSKKISKNKTASVRSLNPEIRSFDLVDDETKQLLGRRRLRTLLKEYGKFPAKHRPFIWRYLLQLPENTEAYKVLARKGTHPSFANLAEKYPIKSSTLFRTLQRTCSALAFWSELFGETPYLPLLAFPFVKIFQENKLQAFEVVATVLTNWCSAWFEYFPNPPINVLCMVENLIAFHDRELYQHLVDCRITTEIYAWPVLQTVFSEVFTEEEWLCLWDTLISYPPSFFITFTAAFILTARGPILRLRSIGEFELFFRSQCSLPVAAVIARAHQVAASTLPELKPATFLRQLSRPPKTASSPPNADCVGEISQSASSSDPVSSSFVPLTRPFYPAVTRFPKFIVNFQIRERERIRSEEKEYLRQRALAEEMLKRTEALAAEEENWLRQQEVLATAEQRRRKIVAEEEASLRERQKCLKDFLRGLKLRELACVEQTALRLRRLGLQQREFGITDRNQQLDSLDNQRYQTEELLGNSNELTAIEATIERRRAENAVLASSLRPPLTVSGIRGDVDESVGAVADDTASRPISQPPNPLSRERSDVRGDGLSINARFPFTSTKLDLRTNHHNELGASAVRTDPEPASSAAARGVSFASPETRPFSEDS